MFSLYLRESSAKPREQELKEVLAMIRDGILASPGARPDSVRTDDNEE